MAAMSSSTFTLKHRRNDFLHPAVKNH